MSYKILEQNGIDNENVDGGAFNNFAAGGRDGIVGGVLSECALTAAGSAIGISPGLVILHGIRVKVTGIETLSLSSVPLRPTSYQIVAQVTLASNGDVDFSFFIRTPQPLVQNSLYQNSAGTYQAELASFTHNPDARSTASCDGRLLCEKCVMTNFVPSSMTPARRRRSAVRAASFRPIWRASGAASSQRKVQSHETTSARFFSAFKNSMLSSGMRPVSHRCR